MLTQITTLSNKFDYLYLYSIDIKIIYLYEIKRYLNQDDTYYDESDELITCNLLC